jgi:hypothetical protein
MFSFWPKPTKPPEPSVDDKLARIEGLARHIEGLTTAILVDGRATQAALVEIRAGMKALLDAREHKKD